MRREVPKPVHLSEVYASQFQAPSVARAYLHRAPYPDDLFDLLADLIHGRPRTVLDLGSGTGSVARGIVRLVDRVDAVDVSLTMLDTARALPDGQHPNIRWVHGSAEDAPLCPPYHLATAGASLHWMDWDRVLPRIQRVLCPDGHLAVFGDEHEPEPWAERLRPLIARYSTNRDYCPYDLIDELVGRRLFEPVARRRTKPVAFVQSIESYVESFHGRNGFSRDRMRPEDAAEFDDRVRVLVAEYCPHGMVSPNVYAEVVWGRPSRCGRVRGWAGGHPLPVLAAQGLQTQKGTPPRCSSQLAASI